MLGVIHVLMSCNLLQLHQGTASPNRMVSSAKSHILVKVPCMHAKEGRNLPCRLHVTRRSIRLEDNHVCGLKCQGQGQPASGAPLQASICQARQHHHHLTRTRQSWSACSLATAIAGIVRVAVHVAIGNLAAACRDSHKLCFGVQLVHSAFAQCPCTAAWQYGMRR